MFFWVNFVLNLHRKIEKPMNRKKFLRVCGILGLSIPMAATLQSCEKEDEFLLNEPGIASKSASSNDNDVLIIGAGAAGLLAGYLLKNEGYSCQILEASPTYGGRMKHTTSFVDFPISLGAEWLHVNKSELNKIVDDPSIQVTTQTKKYPSNTPYGLYKNGQLSVSNLGNTKDLKFVNSSWFNFFEEYIVPDVLSDISFNTAVKSINYAGGKVKVKDLNNNLYKANRVIVTVPLGILKKGYIKFSPKLPKKKRNAIKKAKFWGGIKVFIEFSDKFYPTFLEFPDSETNQGQRLYYDAAYAQTTNKNVFALFAVGKQAKQYQGLSANAQKNYILAELDKVFDGQASANYLQHTVQDWSADSFTHGAYLSNFEPTKTSKTLYQAVKEKVFFAGEAYTWQNDWGSVHNATRAASDAVYDLIDSL